MCRGLYILEAALSLTLGVPKHHCCAEATSLGHLSCVPRGKEEGVHPGLPRPPSDGSWGTCRRW